MDDQKEKSIFPEGLSERKGVALGALIASALTEGLTADEINVFGNFIAQIGATMLYIAAQRQFNKDLIKTSETSGNSTKEAADDELCID